MPLLFSCLSLRKWLPKNDTAKCVVVAAVSANSLAMSQTFEPQRFHMHVCGDVMNQQHTDEFRDKKGACKNWDPDCQRCPGVGAAA